MIVYFVRHGETEMCREGILKGHKDSPLTLNGQNSAEKLGKLLENKSIEIIYTSDLGRCVETSKIINKKLGLKIIKAKKLRERDYGLLNGKSAEEVEKVIDPNDAEVVAPNGESFFQAKERVVEFIDSLKDKNYKVVLIVTHDGILRGIFGGDTSDELFYKLIF